MLQDDVFVCMHRISEPAVSSTSTSARANDWPSAVRVVSVIWCQGPNGLQLTVE